MINHYLGQTEPRARVPDPAGQEHAQLCARQANGIPGKNIQSSP